MAASGSIKHKASARDFKVKFQEYLFMNTSGWLLLSYADIGQYTSLSLLIGLPKTLHQLVEQLS